MSKYTLVYLMMDNGRKDFFITTGHLKYKHCYCVGIIRVKSESIKDFWTGIWELKSYL